MSCSYVVYIDESGCEGFKFQDGSSEWFVLAAVITRKSKDIETVKLIDDVRQMIEYPIKKPIHFRDLKHEKRVCYVDEIAKRGLRYVAVLIHKPSLRDADKFKGGSTLYFYATRILFERVSWLCRDSLSGSEGDGSCEIIFSNRQTTPYDELCVYLNRLKSMSGVSIHWPAINVDKITTYSHGKRMGLQIADAVASSIFFAVTKNRYGHSEPRYASMLAPVAYKNHNRLAGYGIKVMPREAEHLASHLWAPAAAPAK